MLPSTGSHCSVVQVPREFSVEQEVFSNFTLGAIYMGTRGQRMPLFRDTNLFPPTQSATYTVTGLVATQVFAYG